MFHLEFKGDDEFIRFALDSAAIVAMTDVQGTITFVNQKFCEISGYDRDELVGANHRILRSGIHKRPFFRRMYRKIANGDVWHGEICNRKKDGTLYWVDTTIVPHVSATGKVDGYVAIRFDITHRIQLEDALRTSRESLKTLVNVDSLTNLPNRRYFRQHVKKLAWRNEQSGGRFHVALFDIDSFKEINDSFGHTGGDFLLRTVASRLRSLIDDRVFIARLGGDEFGITLDASDDHEAFVFYEKVLESIGVPIRIDSAQRYCSASMGYTVFPQHGTDTASLLKAADLALYRAKTLGRNRCERFRPEFQAAADRRSQLLLEIAAAVKREEIRFFYQPILYPRSARAPSFEALMRWKHPRRGLIGPTDFQAVFAEPATCAALGMYMLDHVFSDMKIMIDRGISFGRVAINLTNADFRSDIFVERFFSRCVSTGISPERFCVEVTEGMFLGRYQKQVDQGLRQLHTAGVEVALDDFGTGYASLTHLQELPINRLKIDRRFVAGILTSHKDRVIVQGVIDIAHGLGKVVTAEGVETAAQAKMLLDMRCDSLQGWYFSKASDVEHLSSTMQTVGEVSRALETEECVETPGGR
ncbi:putative bifunctional diguanylate cyclase/phosphodiesterase [Gluconacetobacter sacchari]|uniref:putative bifunctional diguanylate cyclase/phosphodiesterase n=1 Tax=Gluconacetobacter sacchari TaxID=92759 RepID=UPI0039B483BF